MIGWILSGVVAVPTLSRYLFLRSERFGAMALKSEFVKKA
jgi:hypothetical protein